jgi:hypothetical protein
LDPCSIIQLSRNHLQIACIAPRTPNFARIDGKTLPIHATLLNPPGLLDISLDTSPDDLSTLTGGAPSCEQPCPAQPPCYAGPPRLRGPHRSDQLEAAFHRLCCRLSSPPQQPHAPWHPPTSRDSRPAASPSSPGARTKTNASPAMRAGTCLEPITTNPPILEPPATIGTHPPHRLTERIPPIPV